MLHSNNERLNKLLRFIHKYFPEITALFLSFLYFSTMSPTISESDSGELAAVQATLGIAHPTGYPLFSLVGYLWHNILFPVETIIALNLLNVLWCSLTIIFVIRTAHLLLTTEMLSSSFKSVSLQSFTTTESSKIIASIFAGLTFAFSVTFWMQSSRIEVYALQIFLSSMIIYFLLKAFIRSGSAPQSNQDLKYILVLWFPVFALIGLGFANHMMTIYLLPGILYMFFLKYKFTSVSLKAFIILGIVSFCISSVFYLGMMYRASTASFPVFIFGDPSNLKALLDHITARYYTGFMFQGVDSMAVQARKFIEIISLDFRRSMFIGGEFSLSIILIISGLIVSYLFYRKFFYFSFITIVFSLIIAFNYSISDILEYFLIVLLFFTLSSVFIVNFLLKLVQNKKFYKYLLYLMLSAFLLIQVLINYSGIDKSEKYLYYDYPKQLLSSLKPNSILITYGWDEVHSPSIYLQNYLNIRNDVTIVNPNLLEYDWYLQNFKKKYNSLRAVLNDYQYYLSLDAVLNYNGNGYWRLNENEYLIPDLLCFRIVGDTNYYPLQDFNFNIRIHKNHSDLDKQIIYHIPWLLENRILYEIRFDKIDRAKHYLGILQTNFSYYKISKDLDDLIDMLSL